MKYNVLSKKYTSSSSQVVLLVKKLSTNAGEVRDTSLIRGLGRFPGERNGNQLQYSCLGNLMDRGTWWAIVRRVAKELDMTEVT